MKPLTPGLVTAVPTQMRGFIGVALNVPGAWRPAEHVRAGTVAPPARRTHTSSACWLDWKLCYQPQALVQGVLPIYSSGVALTRVDVIQIIACPHREAATSILPGS